MQGVDITVVIQCARQEWSAEADNRYLHKQVLALHLAVTADTASIHS